MKVVNDAKGQTVYRDHLPLLGEQGPGRSGPHRLQIGDQVHRLYRIERGVQYPGHCSQEV